MQRGLISALCAATLFVFLVPADTRAQVTRMDLEVVESPALAESGSDRLGSTSDFEASRTSRSIRTIPDIARSSTSTRHRETPAVVSNTARRSSCIGRSI